MTDVPVPPSEEEDDPPGPNCFAISASSSLAFADALSGVIVCISLLVCKPCPGAGLILPNQRKHHSMIGQHTTHLPCLLFRRLGIHFDGFIP